MLPDDISDAEFELITDREKLFAEEGGDGPFVPREGVMYDVVAAASHNLLQSVN